MRISMYKAPASLKQVKFSGNGYGCVRGTVDFKIKRGFAAVSVSQDWKPIFEKLLGPEWVLSANGSYHRWEGLSGLQMMACIQLLGDYNINE